MVAVFKCRKCRIDLIENDKCSALSVHGNRVNFRTSSMQFNECKDNPDVIYFQEKDLPDWILCCINKGEWRRGKLNCPKCSARVGAFDFVSGQKCTCSAAVLPPIHLVKSKIDCKLFKKNTWDQQCSSSSVIDSQQIVHV